MKTTPSQFASLLAAAAALTFAPTAAAADAGSLNIICGVQIEWCNLAQTTFSRSTGIKVNLVAKGGGEALAQISAESANPKTDIWFGGTGDPHLQAAEKNLTLAYQSPNINLLRDWAISQARQSGCSLAAWCRVALTLSCRKRPYTAPPASSASSRRHRPAGTSACAAKTSLPAVRCWKREPS